MSKGIAENYVGIAALGCPANEARPGAHNGCGDALRRTVEGGCPTWFLEIQEVADLTLQLCEVTVFAVVALGRAFNELEKLAQIFPFRRFQFGELNADTE